MNSEEKVDFGVDQERSPDSKFSCRDSELLKAILSGSREIAATSTQFLSMGGVGGAPSSEIPHTFSDTGGRLHKPLGHQIRRDS